MDWDLNGVCFDVGEFAVRSLVKIARQLVGICEISYRRDLLEYCLNIENLLSKYKDLIRRRLVSVAPQCMSPWLNSPLLFTALSRP